METEVPFHIKVLRRYLVYKAWREFYSGRVRYKMNKIITLRWHVQLRT